MMRGQRVVRNGPRVELGCLWRHPSWKCSDGGGSARMSKCEPPHIIINQSVCLRGHRVVLKEPLLTPRNVCQNAALRSVRAQSAPPPGARESQHHCRARVGSAGPAVNVPAPSLWTMTVPAVVLA